jgi:hypothetical protein
LVLLPGLEACGNLDQFSTAISARKGLGVEVTGRYRDDTWALSCAPQFFKFLEVDSAVAASAKTPAACVLHEAVGGEGD